MTAVLLQLAGVAVAIGVVCWAVGRRDRVAVRSCRVCGCTDDRACYPPCCWVAIDLCSACLWSGDLEVTS